MDNFGFRLDRDENDYDQNYQDDVDVHKPEDESSFKSSSCDTDFLYYSDKLFTIGKKSI